MNARGELIENLPDGEVLERRSIGGIDCENLVPIRAHSKIQQQIKEQEAEFLLRKKLADAELEYEAILPLQFLEDIRLEFDLFKFMRVTEDKRVLAKLADPAGSAVYGHIILLGVLFYPIVLYGVFNFFGYAGGYGSFLGIAIATFGFYCTQLSNDCSVTGDVEGARVYLSLTHVCNPIAYVCSYIQMKNEGTQDALKSRFWGPKKTDEDLLLLSHEERLNQKVDFVGIKTPIPPPEVSQRLFTWNNAGHDISLLVEEAGFTIVKDSHLLDKVNSYNDPIAFAIFKENDCEFAVLIHQYGQLELVKEKGIIQYVHDHFESIRNIVHNSN